MQITVLTVANPVWANAEQTRIDCQITVEQYPGEVLPFTADPNDTTEHGPKIYADCVAGVYGAVSAYVPPPPPSAAQNKAEAQRRLAATDWVNEPDVYDTSRNPHLINRDAFLDYRSWCRNIAVNPVAGNLNWPTEVQALWSNT
jgi:hypothetical protein